MPFSADPNRGAYVVARDADIPGTGELFCVSPQDTGELLIEGARGVVVAGQPIPERGIKVDIEGFGSINKRYGNPFGDKLLRAFVHRLRDRCEDAGRCRDCWFSLSC